MLRFEIKGYDFEFEIVEMGKYGGSLENNRNVPAYVENSVLEYAHIFTKINSSYSMENGGVKESIEIEEKLTDLDSSDLLIKQILYYNTSEITLYLNDTLQGGSINTSYEVEFKNILQEVEESQAEGKVKTKKQALELARKVAQMKPIRHITLADAG